MTLFGADNATTGAAVPSFEIYSPGGGGSWSAPKSLPFNYFYYPWTFLLPGGDLFVAGPQKPSRRFNPNASPVVAQQYNQLYPQQRGVNMDGTSVLLPLRPPSYKPRVLVAGGTDRGANWSSTEMGALQSAEWIDLSVASPAWQALPDMNIARDKVNSVLLPDGRILILGGYETSARRRACRDLRPRRSDERVPARSQHEAPARLPLGRDSLPDGSVIMGGDPNGGSTPNERYRPSYFFKPRPAITGSPASIGYGAAFSVQTGDAGCDRRGRADAGGSGHARLQSEPALRRLRHHRHDRCCGQGNGSA